MICKNCGKENLDDLENCMFCREKLDNKSNGLTKTQNNNNKSAVVIKRMDSNQKKENNSISKEKIFLFLAIIISLIIVFRYITILTTPNTYHCDGRDTSGGWSCFMSPDDPSVKRLRCVFGFIFTWFVYGIITVINSINNKIKERNNVNNTGKKSKGSKAPLLIFIIDYIILILIDLLLIGKDYVMSHAIYKTEIFRTIPF